MNITDDDLLTGETLILSKRANAVITIAEHGLSKFAFDKYMWMVGMKDQEAIGGKLHLTNYRLIFYSHVVNRLKGKFSIFLPTIRDVQDVSGLIVKKMLVATDTQRYEFVVWGIPRFIEAIKVSKDKISAKQKHQIAEEALSNYEKVGEGLKISKLLEGINVAILMTQKAGDFLELAQNPTEFSTILNLIEMISEE